MTDATQARTDNSVRTGAVGRASAARSARARKRPGGGSNEGQSFGAAALDWLKSMAMGLLLFLVIRTLAIQTYTIISGSMEDTFLIGDFIVVNKVAYGATIPATHARLPGYDKPDHGDIVVFISNHDPGNVSLVKRLIGKPGDTVAMKAGVVYLNGVAQNEHYVKHTRPDEAALSDPKMLWQEKYLVKTATPPAAGPQTYVPKRDDWGPIVVPPDNYFMMGDNRDESYDSRFWGFVEKKDIIGRASFIYFSWASSDSDPPLVHHVRWGRIGHNLK